MQEESGSKQGGQDWREWLCLPWFVVVALAFFAPVLGGRIPMGLLTAFYGLILLVCSTVLALTLSGPKGNKKRVE